MKILHVDTASEWRGGQNQILLTALGQIARGHDVRVFASVEGELAVRCARASIRVEKAAVGRGDLSWRTLTSVRAAAHSFQPDVIHVHEAHGLLAAIMAARACAIRPRLMVSRRVDFPLRFMSRIKYGAMDRVLAVSRAVRQVLADGGMPRERVVLVAEGVSDRAPAPGGRATLTQLGIPETAPLVGNVAQLVDHKDHATLLRAAARVLKVRPDCRFLICGDGPLRGALAAQAQSLGLGAQVIFAGFRYDLDALVPCFDVFCLSSHLEGLGTSVLDAMCFSRPVAATRAGGISDMVVDSETGRLVDPRDDEGLSRALLDLIGDRAVRERYGAAGRARFLKNFTSDVMVDATLAAYGTVRPP